MTCARQGQVPAAISQLETCTCTTEYHGAPPTRTGLVPTSAPEAEIDNRFSLVLSLIPGVKLKNPDRQNRSDISSNPIPAWRNTLLDCGSRDPGTAKQTFWVLSNPSPGYAQVLGTYIQFRVFEGLEDGYSVFRAGFRPDSK